MDLGMLSDAKRRLLDRIKRQGAATVAELAQRLGLTEVAVRQHLQVLEEQELVRAEKQPPQGRGRPSARWSLAAASAPLFPDRHADLTTGLIEAAREVLGDDGLDQLIMVRSRNQLERYRELVPAEGDLGERVEALARRRTEEGYMAEAIEDEPGSWRLLEHHCPICEAAQVCSGLCRYELDLFRAVLGDDVEVERTQHLLADDDRCAYRIKAKR